MVECISSDPDADLALMGGDGTTYENATARIEVSLDNPDATNMTFSCTINAPGPCGQFMFQTSVRVYGKYNIAVVDKVNTSYTKSA